MTRRRFACLFALLAAVPVLAAEQGGRGSLVSDQELRVIGRGEAALLRAMAPQMPAAECDATAYRVRYRTIDPAGAMTTASGLVVLPRDLDRPLPLVSWQHGTTPHREEVPSRLGQMDALLATAYAPFGYVYVAADYLGLGDSPDLHPYMDAASQSTACVDLLRAARALAEREGVELNGQLFLFGYSQGGHATMALHQVLERDHADEFQVTASAPMAGSYDMAGTMLEHMLGDPSAAGTFYSAYILLAQLRWGPTKLTPEQVFRQPWAGQLARLYDGTHDTGEIMRALPAKPVDLILPDVLAAVRADENHPFRAALRASDCYDWLPKAPIRMFHGGADRDVPLANAQLALEAIKARGGDITLVNVGDTLDHGGAAVPSVIGGRMWFESFRQR